MTSFSKRLDQISHQPELDTTHIFLRMHTRSRGYLDGDDEPKFGVSQVTISVKNNEELLKVAMWCDEHLHNDFVWRRTSWMPDTKIPITFYFHDPKNATLFSLTWANR